MTIESNPQMPVFWKRAVLWVVVLEVAGNSSGLITFWSKDWYASLVRPPGTPPDGSFGPVWLFLFAMMGIAAALVSSAEREGPVGLRRKKALRWFGAQFLANMAWTPAFFGFHRIDFALVIILLLLLFLAVTIWRFGKLSRGAAFLLVPYLVWVAYAAYLNAGFWWLNR